MIAARCAYSGKFAPAGAASAADKRVSAHQRLTDRFWRKVDKNGPVPSHVQHLGQCWIWTGAPVRRGYGSISVDGRRVPASHAAWFVATGSWPTLWVCHKCDGGPIKCVRPDHLFLGTRADNMRDMVTKGRSRNRPTPGELHHAAKLTEQLVREARVRHAAGESIASIARAMGESYSTLKSAIGRRSWRHVP